MNIMLNVTFYLKFTIVMIKLNCFKKYYLIYKYIYSISALVTGQY